MSLHLDKQLKVARENGVANIMRKHKKALDWASR